MQEYYFKEIESTQDYAKKIYLDGKSNFVVYSDTQKYGRGRNGRVWESPVGGLWFSFDMNFFDAGGLFTIAIGVAIREVLTNIYNCKVELKWPNDLILNRKKVGGIICEKINDRVIVGIGINTNIKEIKEEKAITFLNKTDISVDNYELMNQIIKRCKEIMKLELDTVIEKFRKNMAYVGEVCYVSSINENVKIVDISSEGHLIVETENGIKEVFAGEITVCI